MKNVKEQAIAVYKEKGLNGLYSFLKKSDINFSKSVYEFGLETNTSARQSKREFLSQQDNDSLRLHYYSVAVRGKYGWSYNRIRAVLISF